MIEAGVMKDAIYRMWLDELNYTDAKGKPDWARRRIAAEQICDMLCVTDAVRAISLDGELRPPPEWPEVDCVPVGGGPGLITCEVRTMHKERGKVSARIGLSRNGKEFDSQQISEAIERGRWELKRSIEAL